MARANGSRDGGLTYSERSVAVGRAMIGRAFRQAGFWGTVGLPFVAVAILLAQPPGWLPLLGAVFVINGLAVVAGHCYSREC